MKRIFGRDKPKMTKVTPISREIPTGVGPAVVLEENQNYPHIYHQHRTVREAVPQRSMGRSSTDEHWDVVSSHKDDDNHSLQPKPHHREREQMQNPRPPALTDSRSSSLASLPPGASPPIPSPHAARSGSPYSNAAAAAAQGRGPTPRERDRDSDKLRRHKQPQSAAPGAGPPHTGQAALGILRALDPFAALDAPADRESKSYKHDHGHQSDEALGDERKEKKGFWGGKDREKDKGKEKKDEENSAELTRMIGFLTATASEDWSLVLEVCDRASASDANAKEAVKALRREFKYAEPSAQLSAARLWAIMLRNSSEIFMQQIMSRKFLDTLEEVLTSTRTSPVVRERLMDVLAAVAYASQNKNKDVRSDKEGFRGLWRRLKPADKPDEGVPFDIDDAMFNPPMPRATSEYSLEPPGQPYQFQQNSSPVLDHQEPPAITSRKRSLRSPRIIPPEEDIRRLFQECKIGQGNAHLLAESLAFARPEDLEKEIIREFYAKCRASQELIYAQIPWASAGAERSRLARGSPQNGRTQIHPNGSYPSLQLRDEEAPYESTMEEELLAALLESNEALLEALRVYDDLDRLAAEKEAEEISRRDVRMDRRQLRYQEEYGLEPPPSHIGASSSRSPSPSPTDSPAQSFQQPAFVPSITHPLPRIPAGLIPANSVNAPLPHLSPYSAQNVGLVPPPPAPHGPRSPAQIMASRTPSPERFAPAPVPLSSSDHHSRTDSSTSSRDYHALHNGLDKLQIGGKNVGVDDDEECITPIKPSAKALGKRKVVEAEEPDRTFDTDDIFYDHRDDPYPVENKLDSDSDEGSGGRWQQTTHYVYDAAAERTQQRIRRGRVSTLVDGVH